MSDFIQITTTSNKKEILQTLAAKLIEARLAACVQIGGPVESVFRWENKIETANEWICTIKTVMQHLSKIESAIFENHNYEVPELIVTAIPQGSQSYLDWIEQQISPGKP